ncbi:MAG: DUF2779 domain-containing protein [Candidatus Omnitrophota bacterium]
MNCWRKSITAKLIAVFLIASFSFQNIVWADPQIGKRAPSYTLQVQSGFNPIENPFLLHETLVKLPLTYLLDVLKKTERRIEEISRPLSPPVHDRFQPVLYFDRKKQSDVTLVDGDESFEIDAWIVPCRIIDTEAGRCWDTEAVILPNWSEPGMTGKAIHLRAPVAEGLHAIDISDEVGSTGEEGKAKKDIKQEKGFLEKPLPEELKKTLESEAPFISKFLKIINNALRGEDVPGREAGQDTATRLLIHLASMLWMHAWAVTIDAATEIEKGLKKEHGPIEILEWIMSSFMSQTKDFHKAWQQIIKRIWLISKVGEENVTRTLAKLSLKTLKQRWELLEKHNLPLDSTTVKLKTAREIQAYKSGETEKGEEEEPIYGELTGTQPVTPSVLEELKGKDFKLVVFTMMGVLTPARQHVSDSMGEKLRRIAEKGVDLCILTTRDNNRVEEFLLSYLPWRRSIEGKGRIIHRLLEGGGSRKMTAREKKKLSKIFGATAIEFGIKSYGDEYFNSSAIFKFSSEFDSEKVALYIEEKVAKLNKKRKKVSKTRKKSSNLYVSLNKTYGDDEEVLITAGKLSESLKSLFRSLQISPAEQEKVLFIGSGYDRWSNNRFTLDIVGLNVIQARGPGETEAVLEAVASEGDEKIVRRIEPAQYRSGERDLIVHFIDAKGTQEAEAKRGDGVFIRTPDGKNILIDAGNGVARFLSDKGITKLDQIIITHGHADHVVDFEKILTEKDEKGEYKFTVGEVVDSGFPLVHEQWANKVRELTKERNIRFIEAKEGENLDWGERVEVKVLNSSRKCPLFEFDDALKEQLKKASMATSSDINNNSIVLSLRYGNVSFLFTGDIEVETEKKLIEKYRKELKDVVVLKLAHHGSGKSSSEDFIKLLPQTEVAISSSVAHSDVINRVAKVAGGQDKVIANTEWGDIIVTTNGQRFKLEKIGAIEPEPVKPPIEKEKPSWEDIGFGDFPVEIALTSKERKLRDSPPISVSIDGKKISLRVPKGAKVSKTFREGIKGIRKALNKWLASLEHAPPLKEFQIRFKARQTKIARTGKGKGVIDLSWGVIRRALINNSKWSKLLVLALFHDYRHLLGENEKTALERTKEWLSNQPGSHRRNAVDVLLKNVLGAIKRIKKKDVLSFLKEDDEKTSAKKESGKKKIVEQKEAEKKSDEEKNNKKQSGKKRMGGTGRGLLTKTNYISGLQCDRYLWTKYNDPEKIPKPEAATLHRFNQGHEVHGLAQTPTKEWFPDGIHVPEDDFMDNIRQTKELLKKRVPLFEAGILVGKTFVRVDILVPVGKDKWDIIEVKSGTKVKDENVDDVSFQKYVCEKFGLKINKCFLMHVNNEYVKKGNFDPKAFFVKEDVTDEADEVIKGESKTKVAKPVGGIRNRIEEMIEVIGKKKCPDVSIDRHCGKPYDCPVEGCKWDSLPPENVFELYRGGEKSYNLFKKEIEAIKDIPADVKLTKIQEIQKHCAVTGKPHINKGDIEDFLSTVQGPLYFLDFETFNPAVPIYEGTRPYQRIPFQFSLHVVRGGKSKVEHYSFLADGTEDPRSKFLAELKKVLGNEGSIIAYNHSFEKGVLRELAEIFPEYKGWVNGVSGRFVDLLNPFRSFHYYNPKQEGSASLKKVLPALTGKSYDGMDIANGDAAGSAFLKLVRGDVSEKERKKIRDDLEKYCGLDTEGMIWILDELKKLVGGYAAGLGVYEKGAVDTESQNKTDGIIKQAHNEQRIRVFVRLDDDAKKKLKADTELMELLDTGKIRLVVPSDIKNNSPPFSWWYESTKKFFLWSESATRFMLSYAKDGAVYLPLPFIPFFAKPRHLDYFKRLVKFELDNLERSRKNEKEDTEKAQQLAKEFLILNVFEKELAEIKDEEVREFAIDALKLAPDYVWESPSSTSGKYHPEDETRAGGLVLHTQRVFEAASKIADEYKLSSDERDRLLVASLFHDMAKYGHTDEIYNHLPSRWEHYRLHPQLVRTMTGGLKKKYEKMKFKKKKGNTTNVYEEVEVYEEIIGLVERHEGAWSREGYEPETDLQRMMHIADYSVARRNSVDIRVFISYLRRLGDLGYTFEQAIFSLQEKQDKINDFLKELERPLDQENTKLLLQLNQEIVEGSDPEVRQIVSEFLDLLLSDFATKAESSRMRSPFVPVNLDQENIYLKDITKQNELCPNFISLLFSIALTRRKVVLAFDNGMGRAAGIFAALKNNPMFKNLLKNVDIVVCPPENLHNQLQEYFEKSDTEIFLFARESKREGLKKLEYKTSINPFYVDDSNFDPNAYYPLLEIVTIALAQFLDSNTVANIKKKTDVLNKVNIADITSDDRVFIFKLLPNAEPFEAQELIKQYALLKKLLIAA